MKAPAPKTIGNPKPIRTDTCIGLTIEWYCKPPPKGVIYTVLQEEMSCEKPGAQVRRVFAWKTLPGTPDPETWPEVRDD